MGVIRVRSVGGVCGVSGEGGDKSLTGVKWTRPHLHSIVSRQPVVNMGSKGVGREGRSAKTFLVECAKFPRSFTDLGEWVGGCFRCNRSNLWVPIHHPSAQFEWR